MCYLLRSENRYENKYLVKPYISDQVSWQFTIRRWTYVLAADLRIAGSLSFKAIHFIDRWALKWTSIRWCSHEFSNSNKTITDWKNYVRTAVGTVLDVQRIKRIRSEAENVDWLRTKLVSTTYIIDYWWTVLKDKKCFSSKNDKSKCWDTYYRHCGKCQRRLHHLSIYLEWI